MLGNDRKILFALNDIEDAYEKCLLGKIDLRTYRQQLREIWFDSQTKQAGHMIAVALESAEEELRLARNERQERTSRERLRRIEANMRHLQQHLGDTA